jgi:hypothetical protein
MERIKKTNLEGGIIAIDFVRTRSPEWGGVQEDYAIFNDSVPGGPSKKIAMEFKLTFPLLESGGRVKQ